LKRVTTDLSKVDRTAHFRLIAEQRREILLAFDRIETDERRRLAVQTCVMLGMLDRQAPDSDER